MGIFIKRLLLTFWPFVLINSNNVSTSQASSVERILHKDGDFIIEALLPITRSNSEEILDTYAIASEAIKHTVEKFNDKTQTDILPNVTLGYDIVDDRSDLNFIMKRAIGIVSKYRPDSICRENEEFCTVEQKGSLLGKRVSAVIGPATSSSSVPSASLLGLYNIPQISFSASSSILSDKSRFRSFLRTIPSDMYQAEAMASFVKHFGWNYVFFIGSDDEYGRQGLTSFKTAARKRRVCTADDVNIPFQRPDDAGKQIKEVIKKMKSLSRVKVAVIFMFGQQAAQILQEAERQSLRNVTWILSDAIGPDIGNHKINKELLHGAFGVDFVYARIPSFEEYILNITVEKAASNPWMLKLLEKTLNCSSSNMPGKRACGKDEKPYNDTLRLASRWSGLINVINSVNAIAYGLDKLLKSDRTFPINTRDLYLYIRNATFTGAIGETVSFDGSGDLMTKKYTFRNVIFDRKKDTLTFERVANWSSLSPDSPIFFKNEHASKQHNGLTWNNGKKPTATCSDVCQPGQKQVGESDCCWACHPCPKGEISNTTGATECYRCLPGWYANERQTECLETEIDYVDSSDAISIVIITISCIGLVVLAAVASLFYYVKSTPLIQDSHPILLGLLVFSAALGLFYSIFQVSLYRTDAACRFLGALLPFVLLLLASTLLAKTTTCDMYLRKFASHYFKPAAEYASLILIAASLLFQLLLMGIWFLTDTPVVHYMKTSQAVHIRECDSDWSAGRFIATGFPLLVLFVATALAFKERDTRKNHHEAKYISFCTISLCILLIAFFPTYRFAQGMTTSIVIAATALVGALAVFGCIILPKVYILLVQPERNVPEDERERSHQTVSSAHTAGSQHQHVFPEPGEELHPPNDVEFMSSSSSASSRGKDVVKDVPIT